MKYLDITFVICDVDNAFTTEDVTIASIDKTAILARGLSTRL